MDGTPVKSPLKHRQNNSAWLVITLAGGLLYASSALAGTCTPDPGFAHCQTIDYTGSVQTFTVPAGVTSLDIRLWGAAGGGTNWGGGSVGGGGAGFTSGQLAVSSGEVLSITVGQGGQHGQTGIFGGGGNAGSTSDGGAPGGGLSAVASGSPLSAANVLLVAGGGGGGASGTAVSSGGAGGGASGLAGGAVSGGGTVAGGGTQTGGGAGGTGPYDLTTATAGSQFQGGTGGQQGGFLYSGAGGGGGYYGGGGGADWAGGGAGSGYCASGGLSACTTTAGSGLTPAGTSDPQYQSGIGAGVSNGAGGNGLVVIQWGTAAPTSIPTLSTWGMILLASLLAMFGLYGVRRSTPHAG